MEFTSYRSSTTGWWLRPRWRERKSNSGRDPAPSRGREFHLCGNCSTGVMFSGFRRRAKSTRRPRIVRLRIQPKNHLQQDEGSAIVEFVILAVPLLIPIILYLGAIHENSTLSSDLHNLARQSARAFITSGDESFEGARMQRVLNLFESKVLSRHGIGEIPTLRVECSASPCLTPDSRVKVTATISRTRQTLGGFLRFIPTPNSTFSASDIQIVDAWR